MKLTQSIVASLALLRQGAIAGSAPAGAKAGATACVSTVPGGSECDTTGDELCFGRHYAVLNLDMINGLVAGVEDSPEGQRWINNTARWIDAVHRQSPPPLSIFTRIYFSNELRPEIAPDIAFAKAVAALGNATESSPQGQLYPAFKPLDNYDVVMKKTRYYAGSGNAMEQILSTQKIDTVILSTLIGIRTSGVILATASHLFDLNYRVIVISNNTIETPPEKNIPDAILNGILPKLPVEVVTIEEAMAALERSGPAIY